MLADMLGALGFQDLHFFDYGVSNDPVLAGLERHGGWQIDCGYPSVWVVEAMRDKLPIVWDAIFCAEMEQKFLHHVESGH